LIWHVHCFPEYEVFWGRDYIVSCWT
jgi:hypothetical protein